MMSCEDVGKAAIDFNKTIRRQRPVKIEQTKNQIPEALDILSDNISRVEDALQTLIENISPVLDLEQANSNAKVEHPTKSFSVPLAENIYIYARSIEEIDNRLRNILFMLSL